MNRKPRHLPPAGIYARRQLAAIAERWNQRAQHWDQDLQDPACHLNEDEAYQRFLDAARQLIAARRDFCARYGVIDAGCGTGLVLSQVITGFAWGVGVDISDQMIRKARIKKIPNARFFVGDCFRLTELCPPAGAVLSRGVLLSHYGREQAVRLLKSVLASLVPGGFALLDFLNRSARLQYRHQPQAKTFFNRGEVLGMARRAGFPGAKVLGEDVRRVLLVLVEAP